MFSIGQEVRVTKCPGMCCGVGLCGVQAKVQQIYFTSPYSRTGQARAYELSTGDIVKEQDLEAL